MTKNTRRSLWFYCTVDSVSTSPVVLSLLVSNSPSLRSDARSLATLDHRFPHRILLPLHQTPRRSEIPPRPPPHPHRLVHHPKSPKHPSSPPRDKPRPLRFLLRHFLSLHNLNQLLDNLLPPHLPPTQRRPPINPTNNRLQPQQPPLRRRQPYIQVQSCEERSDETGNAIIAFVIHRRVALV